MTEQTQIRINGRMTQVRSSSSMLLLRIERRGELNVEYSIASIEFIWEEGGISIQMRSLSILMRLMNDKMNCVGRSIF